MPKGAARPGAPPASASGVNRLNTPALQLYRRGGSGAPFGAGAGRYNNQRFLLFAGERRGGERRALAEVGGDQELRCRRSRRAPSTATTERAGDLVEEGRRPRLLLEERRGRSRGEARASDVPGGLLARTLE